VDFPINQNYGFTSNANSQFAQFTMLTIHPTPSLKQDRCELSSSRAFEWMATLVRRNQCTTS